MALAIFRLRSPIANLRRLAAGGQFNFGRLGLAQGIPERRPAKPAVKAGPLNFLGASRLPRYRLWTGGSTTLVTTGMNTTQFLMVPPSLLSQPSEAPPEFGQPRRLAPRMHIDTCSSSPSLWWVGQKDPDCKHSAEIG